jgi:hypothetical protein
VRSSAPISSGAALATLTSTAIAVYIAALVRRLRSARLPPRSTTCWCLRSWPSATTSPQHRAALLTITGYSVNDTIVIFDRVRENLRSKRRDSLESVVNLSVNQTLGRTIITAGTTFLSVLALYLFGGEVLEGFAFTMLVASSRHLLDGLHRGRGAILLSGDRRGRSSAARKRRPDRRRCGRRREHGH